MKRVLVVTLVLVGVILPQVAFSQWNTQVVDDFTSGYGQNAICHDSSGFPHIAYVGNSYYMRYASWNDVAGGWDIEVTTVYGSTITCALILDELDQPHILYGDNYVTREGTGDWIVEEFHSAASHAALYLTYDHLDRVVPHVSYYSGQHLWYTYRDPDTGVWQPEEVDAVGQVGMHSSIAVDSGGGIYISYYDYSGHSLKFAYDDGTEWLVFIVDGLTDYVGEYTSLVLDEAGVPHITYYDATNDELKHATITLGG